MVDLFNATSEIKYDAIVIGAGVIGPCVATGLARMGKKVLIVERDWSLPQRIVGELMQPGGVRALRSLGMIQSINNINAQPVTGYTVIYNGEKVIIPYPFKSDVAPIVKLDKLIKNGNDQVVDDTFIKRSDFEDDERERGVAFVHGEFLMNLRKIVQDEPNITCLQGNCIEILKNNKNEIIGAKVEIENRGNINFNANVTFICDGIFSHLRTELSPEHIPKKDSSFVGMSLFNTNLPTKYHGHVVIGDKHMPIIIYQISPTETRILCAYNSPNPPKDIKNWLLNDVKPFIPNEITKSFIEAVDEHNYKCMPNSYLPARQNDVIGLCVIGDALNMRHPLTGGGMTVGLNDVVLMLQKIGHLDFNDRATVLDELLDFHYDKKNYDTVINVLSIALYSLFAAQDNNNLKFLQKGCFKYFQRGGDCINVPIQFLSGLLPSPLQLTKVFFSVALYTIYLRIEEMGIFGFPLAILQGISILFTAIKVFTPYLLGELMG